MQNKNTCMNIAFWFAVVSDVLLLIASVLTFGLGLIFFIPNLIATIYAQKSMVENNRKKALVAAILFLFFGNIVSTILAFVAYSQMANVVDVTNTMDNVVDVTNTMENLIEENHTIEQ